MRLTNVTRRWSAAPDGGGAEAAELVGEVAFAAPEPDVVGPALAGTAVGRG
jgi:hypothetical protein